MSSVIITLNIKKWGFQAPMFMSLGVLMVTKLSDWWYRLAHATEFPWTKHISCSLITNKQPHLKCNWIIMQLIIAFNYHTQWPITSLKFICSFYGDKLKLAISTRTNIMETVCIYGYIKSKHKQFIAK